MMVRLHSVPSFTGWSGFILYLVSQDGPATLCIVLHDGDATLDIVSHDGHATLYIVSRIVTLYFAPSFT